MTQVNKRKRRRDACRGMLGEAFPPGLFKALSDPNRIALLAKLAECRGGCTVTEAATCCSVDLSVVSRHLRTLRDAGILQAARKGKEVRYRVRGVELARTLRAMAETLSACCGGGCRETKAEGEAG
jgi:DNA-binding transcriptional ArsR family regulator